MTHWDWKVALEELGWDPENCLKCSCGRPIEAPVTERLDRIEKALDNIMGLLLTTEFDKPQVNLTTGKRIEIEANDSEFVAQLKKNYNPHIPNQSAENVR